MRTKTPLQPSLDQLSVKAKHVVGSLDEIVWAVNPREDTLRSLVDYLAAFAREFLDIARIPLRVDVARDIPELPLPTAQRHAVFLAAREALNNIVKHSGATEVQLRDLRSRTTCWKSASRTTAAASSRTTPPVATDLAISDNACKRPAAIAVSKPTAARAPSFS